MNIIQLHYRGKTDFYLKSCAAIYCMFDSEWRSVGAKAVKAVVITVVLTCV